jgi:hypothetical protein
MTRRQIGIVLLLAISSLVFLGVAPRAAASRSNGGPYTLAWTGISGGGSIKGGGAYRLSGASGQSSTGTSTAGDYQMTTGFIAGIVARDYVIYLPLVLSG